MFKKIVSLILLTQVALLSQKPTFAQSSPPYNCNFSVTPQDSSDNDLARKSPTEIYNNFDKLTFSFDLNSIPKLNWNWFPQTAGQPTFFTKEIIMDFRKNVATLGCVYGFAANSLNTSSTASYTKDLKYTRCALRELGTHSVKLLYLDSLDNQQLLCQGNFTVIETNQLGAEISIVSTNNLQDVNSEWEVTIKNVTVPTVWGSDFLFLRMFVNDKLLSALQGREYLADRGNLNELNTVEQTLSPPYIHFRLKPLIPGTHVITLRTNSIPKVFRGKFIASKEFDVLPFGAPTYTPTPIPSPTPLGAATPTSADLFPYSDLTSLCDKLDTEFRTQCSNCIKDGVHIWTAIGCLPTDFGELLKNYIFTFGAGIAGGTSFIFFLYGTILILVSAGDPEKIEQGKQIITSAISGLLLIIFSVFLLRVIGVDILRLPGFE